MKPDWRKAPKWARYLSRDESGEYYWYENEPYIPSIHHVQWKDRGGRFEISTPDVKKKWMESLETRP